MLKIIKLFITNKVKRGIKTEINKGILSVLPRTCEKLFK